jgi:hypothetical protein
MSKQVNRLVVNKLKSAESVHYKPIPIAKLFKVGNKNKVSLLGTGKEKQTWFQMRCGKLAKQKVKARQALWLELNH